MKNAEKKKKLLNLMIRLSLVWVLAAAFLVLPVKTISAQEDFVPGVSGFVDEDGDGFNDLLPDSDGDGIPNALDPDFRGHKADSIFMHRQSEAEQRNMWQYMNEDQNHMEHGEPGMFGPGDSTGHGGMHDDGHGGHDGGGGMGGSPPDEGGGMNSDDGGMGHHEDGDMGPGGGSDDGSDEGDPGHGGHDDPGDGEENDHHDGGPGGG